MSSYKTENVNQTTLNDLALQKEILFDQYSRYKACAEILENVNDADSTILDVGCGENPVLGRFLQNPQITYVDPLLAKYTGKINKNDNKRNKIAGYVDTKELDGQSFDYVVCIDTLEHIAPAKRNAFIERLCNLAKNGILLAFPAVDAGDAVETDKWVDEVYQLTYGKHHEWLQEHFIYGLPSLYETIEKLKSSGWEIRVLQNGYTPWLRELLGFTVCALEIAELNPVIYELSSYFNEYLYTFDYREPAYRQIILATRGIAITLPKRPVINDDLKSEASLRWEYVKKRMIVYKGLKIIKTELNEKNELIQSQQKEIEKRNEYILSESEKFYSKLKEKDEYIQSQNKDIQEVSDWAHSLERERNEKLKQIEQLNGELSEIKSSNREKEVATNALSKQIMEKQDHIDDLNQQLSDSLNRLNLVYSSKLFNIAQKIGKYIKSLKKTFTLKNFGGKVMEVFINTDNVINISSNSRDNLKRNKNIKRIKQLPETGNVNTKYNIDEFSFDEPGQILKIRGWGIHLNHSSAGNKINIVLQSENRAYTLETTIEPRPDVTAAFKTLNFDKSGFFAHISLKGLRNGKYKIGLIIKKDTRNKKIDDDYQVTSITKKPLKSCNYRHLLKKAKIYHPNSYDVIFFSIINWDFRFQRPQHLACGFEKKGHRVFYLNVDFNEGNRCSYRKISKNIFEIFLPYGKKTSIYVEDTDSNIEILQNAAAALVEEFSIKECVAIVEYPMWYPLVKYFKDTYNAVIVFDVLDEFSGFSNAHQDIVRFEEKMMGISDYFICTSGKIFKRLKLEKNNVKLIPNAAAFDFFKVLPKNKLLKDLKKPVIGYYGAIAEWFDIDIIEYIARSKPGWSIVLIGHSFGANLEKLKKIKNIHILGEKPYNTLPRYLYWFDVCMIPFKLPGLILSCNPVKFYEYISSGKPVVATNLPELHQYSDIVYLANSKEEFLEKIELALEEKDTKIRKKRVNTAKNNDWNHRLEEIESLVKKTFPRVSIIIVTFNNKSYTELCIESILAKTAYPNYEIIIVDNASSDGTQKYLKKLEKTYPSFKIIFNEKNDGFSKANNQGIALSEGRYVILLNSDTVVTRGWMGGLIKYFKNSSVGMVCPVTNNIGNEARINISYFDLNYMDSFAEKYTLSHLNESFEIEGCAMFCVVIAMEAVKKVGLLDERFGIGTFEDDDYSFRIKNAGYKLLCVEDVFIHHFGNVSFKKLGDGKYQRIMEENLEKFEEKWGFKWEGHKYRDGVTGFPPEITYDPIKYLDTSKKIQK